MTQEAVLPIAFACNICYRLYLTRIAVHWQSLQLYRQTTVLACIAYTKHCICLVKHVFEIEVTVSVKGKSRVNSARPGLVLTRHPVQVDQSCTVSIYTLHFLATTLLPPSQKLGWGNVQVISLAQLRTCLQAALLCSASVEGDTETSFGPLGRFGQVEIVNTRQFR